MAPSCTACGPLERLSSSCWSPSCAAARRCWSPRHRIAPRQSAVGGMRGVCAHCGAAHALDMRFRFLGHVASKRPYNSFVELSRLFLYYPAIHSSLLDDLPYPVTMPTCILHLLFSTSTTRRPSFLAATPVLPEPANRSTTKSFGSELVAIITSASDAGFSVG